MHWEKERDIVQRTDIPITQKSLSKDLRETGLGTGDTVLVHSSMSKIGWVVGGPVSVINALMDVITTKGTLVMPTFSTDNTEPKNWKFPPVPESWWVIIRENMPAYHAEITPTRGMGRVPETFRNYPTVKRSPHPQCSFTAWGKDKELICTSHPLFPVFGENSPLERLYHLKAKILLLGVDHINNTSLHYSEWKAKLPNHPFEDQGASIMKNGKQTWEAWKDIKYSDEDFIKAGKRFEETYDIPTFFVGQAKTKLLPMQELVDFTIPWFQKNRRY